MRHELKIWPEFYNAVDRGEKTFEVRKGEDRQYASGDLVALREWDPKTKKYTGSFTTKVVTYVMHGGPWLPADVWVFGIRELQASDMGKD